MLKSWLPSYPWCDVLDRYYELPVIAASVVCSSLWNVSKRGSCVDFKCL